MTDNKDWNAPTRSIYMDVHLIVNTHPVFNLYKRWSFGKFHLRRDIFKN